MRNTSLSRHAAAIVERRCGSTVGPGKATGTVYADSALTLRRRREGRTCSSFTSGRTHGIAQRAEADHVVADGPRADLQPLRQVGAGPIPAVLEKGQNPQQALRGAQHPGFEVESYLGSKRSAITNSLIPNKPSPMKGEKA